MTHEERVKQIQHRMIDGAVYEDKREEIRLSLYENSFMYTDDGNEYWPIDFWEYCEQWTEIEPPKIEGHPDNPRYEFAGIVPPKTWGEMAYRQIVNREPWVWYEGGNNDWYTDVESITWGEIHTKLGLLQPDGTVKEVER